MSVVSRWERGRFVLLVFDRERFADALYDVATVMELVDVRFANENVRMSSCNSCDEHVSGELL